VGKGAILVLSGPSGAGKSTIIHEASQHIGSFYFSISTTTRAPRDGEVHGREYFFVSKEEFEVDIQKGNFLEYAKVHDNYYGTSLNPVNAALKEGKLVIFDIDVQGHTLIREKLDDITTSAFITPSSLEELERRLKERSTDEDTIIKNRIKNAKEEILMIKAYDFIIINDDLNKAVNEFISIANAARLKRSKEDKKDFLKKWLA
jgi:guanylate kinase